MAQKIYKSGAKAGKYASAGRTRDGVVLLRPVKEPVHFTREEIRKTIEHIRAKRDDRSRETALQGR